MKCNDQSMKVLKGLGYNVIRLPRADIRPLQILMKNASAVEPLGEISDLLVQGENRHLPTITYDATTASISGKRTSDFSLDIGLDILGNILHAMGGSSAGLQAQYGSAKSIAFQFNDVLTDSVSIVKVDQFLADAGSDPFSRHLKALLEDDRIYLITSTIKSKALSVEAMRDDKTALEVDASAMKQIFGPNVKVSSSTASASNITFAGTEYLIFGFKAIKLIYKNGSYVSFEPAREGSFKGALVGADPQSASMGDLEEAEYNWYTTDNELIDFGYDD